MSFIVSVNWLKEKLENKSKDIIVIDVRAALNDPNVGENAYKESHIPHAVFIDLNNDISGKVAEHGGNHPLPNTKEFTEKMSEIGVGDSKHVVIYDETNDMFASRLWWLLYYMGHENVSVLDGGFREWTKAGNSVTTEIPELNRATFQPQIREDTTVNMEEVKEKMTQSSAVLIDSRAEDRYLGTNEPMYKKAGHIPGAINFYWQNVLNKEGMWKSRKELESNFSTVPKDAEIIVSCGSGISACPNIIGLKEAGYENVKLYPGSFSDWISYPENDVATGEV